MGLSFSLGNLSSERARPMYLTSNRAKWERGPSTRQAIGIWACQPAYPPQSTEPSNLTTCYPLPFDYHTGDKTYELLNSRYHL